MSNPYFTDNGTPTNAPSPADNEATSLQKINANLLAIVNGGTTGSGVTSFNTRTGAVTLLGSDIPDNSANTTGSAGSVALANITGAGTGVLAAGANATNAASGLLALNSNAGFASGSIYYGTFSATNNQDLIIGSSADGITWKTVYSNFAPPTGVLANPSIIKIGSTYWMTFFHGATPSSTETVIGIANSPDLINWTFIQDVTVSATAKNCWAPEWFYDAPNNLYRIYLSIGPSDDSAPQIYELHPTSSSAPVDASTTWSTATIITGTSLPAKMIDPNMVYRTDIVGHGPYFLWYKNETSLLIEIYESTAPTTGFVSYKTGDWMGIGSTVEAPSVVLRPDGTWILYYNRYAGSAPTEWYTIGNSAWSSWSTAVRLACSQGLNHGTVLYSPAFSDVCNALGATAGNAGYNGCTLFGEADKSQVASPQNFAFPTVIIGPNTSGSGTYGTLMLVGPGSTAIRTNGSDLYFVTDPSGSNNGIIMRLERASSSVGNIHAVTGSFVFDAIGKTTSLKGGSNAASGTVTLTAGAGTISSTAITAKSAIWLTRSTTSGAGVYPQIDVVAGTATITGAATDNGTYNWGMALVNQ